ncbi:MAG: sugar transferase [Bacteroidota bacterium]
MSRRYIQGLIYLLSDFLSTYGVWLFFVLLRRETLEGYSFLEFQQYINAAVISTGWLFLYAFAGLYHKPLRKSRMAELIQVFKYTLIGVLGLFFAFFLDDPIPPENPSLQRILLMTYMGLQFGAVAGLRFIITTITSIQIRRRILGFPTLLIGSGKEANKIFDELEGMRRGLGYDFKGYISINGTESKLKGKLKHFGKLDRLGDVIRNRKIEEVIIALDEAELKRAKEIIPICESSGVYIKVVPGTYDYIMGSVKVSHILGAPLIEVYPQMMKTWEQVAKRIFDALASGFALLILSPIYLLIALLIKMDSKGPIFFKQERIGKSGKPFFIFKFRSMYQDAEKMGPALSSDDDPRITRMGRFLRKTRLDELPQFWNVLKGEMSIVGPRPERQFYIDQIVKIAPHYIHLHKVRPGITSWGQVKYGYASTVEEMVQRLTFDILYLENMSIALDFKILLFTVIVMIEGRGK